MQLVNKFYFFFLFSILSAAVLGQKPSEVVVTPTRVLLDSASKSADITLLNRGTQTYRYRLTLVEMEMSEDGVLKRVPEGRERSAAKMLRLAPREVVLRPGEAQRIKIARIAGTGIPDGEFRSHLAFEPVTMGKPGLTGAAATNSEGLRINLVLRTLVTIPVIVRQGKLSATASISEASVAQDASGWVARLRLNRSGNRSLRGDLILSFAPKGGGAKVVVGQIRSLPVYCPNASRLVTVRLAPNLKALGAGELEIRFREPGSARDAASAKADVPLRQ